MALDPAARQETLERARALYEGREYRALVDHLSPLPRSDLLADPELAFWLADGWRRLGERDQALELTRAFAPVCRRRGNDRLNRNRLNLEGMLLFERGDVMEAQAQWQELHEAASEAADDEFVARATNNLGVVFTLQGAPAQALLSYGRAMTAYQRLGQRRGLAQAHHNAGIQYAELGFLREADAHFRQATEYARADGSEDEVARTEQERALLWLYRGDARLAEATARTSLRCFRSLGDAGGEGLALRVLGLIALADARREEARRHLDAALALARRTRDALLEAETLEALAAVENEHGEAAAAAAARRRADDLFDALGARSWGERVRTRVASIVAAGRRSAAPDAADAGD
ncbi:MAG: tetratricopeptide repeat protein [Gemmatimonadetes bacterium]|nr:tetratricopeptide repeat protein [Gemmatimonadota bacterium]